MSIIWTVGNPNPILTARVLLQAMTSNIDGKPDDKGQLLTAAAARTRLYNINNNIINYIHDIHHLIYRFQCSEFLMTQIAVNDDIHDPTEGGRL